MGKKVESAAQANELVHKCFLDLFEVLRKHTSDMDRLEGWLLASRSINSLFSAHYKISLGEAENQIKAVDKIRSEKSNNLTEDHMAKKAAAKPKPKPKPKGKYK